MKKLIFIVITVLLANCVKEPQQESNNSGDPNNSPSNVDTISAKGWTLINSANDFGTGSSQQIFTTCKDNHNNIYVAGRLFGGTDGYFVCKWNGTKWSRVGTDANALNANGYINYISVDDNGNLYATGDFNDANGNYYIAKWNGTNWTSIGTITQFSGVRNDEAQSSMCSMVCDNYNLYVLLRGKWKISSEVWMKGVQLFKYNGNVWQKQGNPINYDYSDGSLWGLKPSLGSDINNNIYFLGDSVFNFKSNESYLAKWNGSNWNISSGASNYVYEARTGICSPSANTIFCLSNSIAFTPSVLKFSNASWTDIGIGYGYNTFNNGFVPSSNCQIISTDGIGNVYVLRNSTPNAMGGWYLSKLNGVTWQNYVNPIPEKSGSNIGGLITTKKGSIYVVDNYDNGDNLYYSKVYKLNQ